MSSFDGEEFGREIVAIVQTALDKQKAQADLQIAALGERIAYLEGQKASRQNSTGQKPNSKRGRKNGNQSQTPR